jgi:hypothetical protein
MTPESWNQLEELFDQAMDCAPGEERDRFIDACNVLDESVRDWLRRLVRQAETGGEQIAKVIQNVAEEAASSVSQPVQWINRRIGPYQILREIGRGGMGIVFEAHRADTEFEKRVAIKIAPDWRRSAKAIERFREERQILARLEHPGICRLLDGGTEDRIPYFVMELVDGVPLLEHCSTLPRNQRIELFLQVCSAVQYAHERLVIHRDLKPSNILVDTAAQARLLDFGIATIAGLVSGQHGERLLTPDYSSPEQLRNQPVSVRTDVYALGLILFEMLTGLRAQKADTSSAEAMERSIAASELPSVKDLGGDLNAILRKAVEKDPEKRYASVEQLASDLRKHLQHHPVEVRRHEPGYRLGRFLRRNWIPMTAASVAVASLIGGVIAFGYEARIANERFATVRKLATRILFDVHDQVARLPGSTAVRGMLTTTAAEQLESLSNNASNNWPLRKELAEAYFRLGQVHGPVDSSLVRFDQAVFDFEKGLEHVNALPPAERATIEVTEGNLLLAHARMLANMGQRAKAKPEMERAEKMFAARCAAEKDAATENCRCWYDALILLTDRAIGVSDLEGAQAWLAVLDRAILKPTASERESVHIRAFARFMRVRLLIIQDKFAECRNVLREIHVDLEWLLAHEPVDPRDQRLVANAGHLYGCFNKPGTSTDDRVFAESSLRRSLRAVDVLRKRDPTDERARYIAAIVHETLGEWLFSERLEEAITHQRIATEELRSFYQSAVQSRNTQALAYGATDRYIAMLLRKGKRTEAEAEARATLRPFLANQTGAPVQPDAENLQVLLWLARSAESHRIPSHDQLWDDSAKFARSVAARYPEESRKALDDYARYRARQTR